MSTTEQEKDPNVISAVERALDVLLYISSQPSPVGISEISKALGVYKSTVFRTLVTLQSRNFVRQDSVSGKYDLGISLMAMSKKLSIYDVFKPFAEALCKEFKEVVNISVLDSTSIDPYRTVLVVKAESNNVLSVNPELGSSSPCYCSSVGKCLLAFSKSVTLEGLQKYQYVKYTENTIDSLESLLAAVRQTREVGYAIDNEEQELGLTCVGVPLFDRRGDAVAALSLSGPTTRVRALDIGHIVARLKTVASEMRSLL